MILAVLYGLQGVTVYGVHCPPFYPPPRRSGRCTSAVATSVRATLDKWVKNQLYLKIGAFLLVLST